jgi:hypothetical protein
VKDEADIVGYTVEYLLGQVDEVVVSDNGSTDGTLDVLDSLACPDLVVLHDPDVAYYQAEKTSRLAADALERGHQWVVPCDADELWYATDGRPLAAFLAGLAPDVAYVEAELYNHLPAGIDAPDRCDTCGDRGWTTEPGPEPDLPNRVPCETCGGRVQPNPYRRIGWRQREHGALPKVACRLRPGLEIRQGNHSAYAPGSGLAAGGLCVRHLSWRSADQYERKIANGYAAYAATALPDAVGAHWRMFGPPDDPTFAERVRDHFHAWFHVPDPTTRPDLIYDPAPYRTRSEQRDNSAPPDGVQSATKGDPMDEDQHDERAEPPEAQAASRRLTTLQTIHDDLEAALFAAESIGGDDLSEAQERAYAILEFKLEEAFLWTKRAIEHSS